ncbi:unnamed protein product, partial [Trichobilharzia regenti]
TEEQLTEIWSQCIDNYPISDNDIDDVDDPIAFDDDIDMKNTDSDDFYSFTKKKEAVNNINQNKIMLMDHLKNRPIISLSSPSSSSSRVMMMMRNTAISKRGIPDYLYTYIPKNNKHKSTSSSTLSSIQLFNEKYKPITDEQIKLSFGRRYKSCEFHALNNQIKSKCNKRQFAKKITSSSKITSNRCNNCPLNVYSSSLEHLNNNWDVQYSMGKCSSSHRNNNNNNNNNSDEEKSIDLESPVRSIIE